MTDIERLEKFQKLKDMINGPEADEFKNYWDGDVYKRQGPKTILCGAVPPLAM